MFLLGEFSTSRMDGSMEAHKCSKCSDPVYRGANSSAELCERCLAEAKLTGEDVRPKLGAFVFSVCEICGEVIPYSPLDPVGAKFCSLCERVVCSKCMTDAPGLVCRLCLAEQVLRGES